MKAGQCYMPANGCQTNQQHGEHGHARIQPVRRTQRTHCDKYQCTGNARCGVDFFLEDQRDFVADHITHHTTGNPSHHPHDHGCAVRYVVLHGDFCANHGKHRQAECIG